MNWTQITKRGRLSVLPNIYSMEAVTTITNQLLNNICYKKVLITFEKRDMHVFVDTESKDLIQEKGLTQIRRNPKIFDHTVQEINSIAKEWLQWLKTLETQNKSNTELIKIYLQYREYYKEIYGRYFTILILENPLTAQLQEILKQKASEENRAEYFTILTSTIEAMHNKKEERDRLQLALKIKKYNTEKFLENPEINAWIEQHTEKYFWLTRDYEDPHLTKDDFIKKIKEDLSDKELEKRAHRALHEEEEHHKQLGIREQELNLNTEEIEFFRIMRAGIFLKELRKSIVSQSLFHFDKVLNEICKRTGLTIELTRMLLPHDLKPLLLEGKPYTETLQKRFNKSVYLIQDGKYIAYTGKEAEKWFNKLINVDNTISEIKGMPASAGIASGPARIVLHPSDFHKVKEGDVMITVQAVPSFLDTIKKCKALVADGGTGITSHPATLAREAKIPCVINAKIATEVIKDGDLIEVDGNKGIIKRIAGKKETSLEDFPCKNLICANDEPNMNILTIGPHIQGMHRSQIKERIGTCMTTLAAEYKNKRMWFYTIKTESEEYGKKAFEKIQQDKHFIKNLLEEIKQCAEKTYVLGQQLQKKQWKLTKEEKCNVFDELYENHAHACMLGYVTVVADLENQLLTDNAFNKLNKAVEKTRSKKSTNEYFAVLTTITEDTIIQKEKLALLEVAKKIQKNNINKSQQQKELEKIHQKYCWANFGYNGPAKTIEEYEQELRIILEKDAEKELKTAQKEKEEITHQQKQFEKELELTSDELYAIECVKDTTITKLIRKDFIAYSCYLFHLLLEETRKQYNLTVEELQHLTPHEARNILRGDLKPNKQELQKRIEHCVYIYNNEKEKMLYDSEGEQFIKNNIFEERIEQASELKGMAAYLGKVQGRAVIVNTKADIQKISEGDILISYATSPEILPAMKKASAFVTDHGGATCHAAIVAREMKKPCIIGTKYATKVFKDDDIIEVDAHTGIVKTIEKKEATKEKYEWKEFASDFNSPLMRNHLWTKSWIAQAKIFDLPFVEIGVKGEKNTIEYIAKIETWFNAHNILRKRVESNPKWVESLIFKTNQLGEETNAWSEKVFAEEKLQAYTAEELCTLLNEFIEKQGLLYAYGTLLPVLDFQGFSYVEGTLKKILQEKMPAEYAEAYKVFTAPAYNSFQQDQEEELLQLMNEYYTKEWKNDINSLNEQEIQKKHSQFWKRLEQHTKKHAWVYYVYQGPSFTETNFLEFISQHLKKEKTPQEQLEQIQKNKKEIEKKKVKYLEKIKPTAFEKNILLLTGIVVWGKPRRKDYQSKTYYHAEYFYREIAKRVQCSLQEARFADPELLKNALRTNTTIDKKHCEDSYNFHVVIPKNSEEIEIFVGKEAEEFYKKVEKEKKCEGGKTEINGSCACPGTATGTVKIINSPEDMHKMQQGDILVSVATTPSIVPAMKKAAAIITNEGGITCHASIVSRELNIPCIVGTKYATQILQDEDFVEVDATHGIIKIQNKKKYIAWFNEVNNTNVLLVGGKGASLGEMYSIMPVPNGFCITVDAYKEAIQPILHEINEILNKKSQTIEELNQKEKAIQAKIYAIEIPQRIQERIKQEYKKLGGNVAVRSSATTEDLEDASFAGQQDTYLNITGESAVLEAVKKCWASLFNARAIQYREEKGFKHEDAYLAVVIQCMIDADAAGVLFTANPVNNSRKEIILEACSGLGEKLVSGEITPDTYIIQKETEEIIQEIISGEQRIISKETVQEIVQLGKEIEKHYKKPMDIEWAIKDNKIHILQARPITTLEQEAKEKWITNFSIEYCGSQLIHPALETAFTRSMDILFDKRHVKRFLAIMDGIHLKNACVKETEIQEFVDAIINKIINEPITIKRIHTEAYVYNDAYINTAKKYINKDFSKIRDAKLAEIYQTLLDAQNKGHAQALTTTWFVDSYQEKFSKWLLEKTEEITQNKDIAETFSILTTSARNSLALQEEIESMKIVAMIEECSEKDKILNWQNPSEMPECSIKNIMEAHYQKWRWMPFAYMGPAYEREYYLEVWKGLVRENINPKKRIRELEQRPEIIKKQKQEIIKKLNIDKEMQTIYEIAADITFLKGYRKEAMYHGMFALSYILKEIAIRLHIHYKGMYLLTPYEISEALINKAPIDSTALYERKGKHCFVYNYEKNSVEEYRGKEAEEFLSTQEFIIEEIKETDTLKGTTACAGYTKGIVKIINHPADMSKMNENNILVAHTTMPSLLPAMKKASAIITEDGGITCHAAIVSRELKIPCVTGIKNATKVLKDNDIIEVDANQGIVRIIP